MWFSALCAIEQAEFHSLCLETLPFSILSVFSSAPGHTPVFRTSRFLVTEPCCQGPATSCKIFPGPEMAETSRNVILFDAMWLCHSSVLMRSPRCACYVTSGPSCDPDTRPDWLWSHASASSKMRGLILLHHKEIMCLSIYLNCVSGFSSVAR